ncbi:MAG: hypothetical protein P0Y49_19005 [Candidatus Pedobacter colombiensis]|uniref:Uncharacterized protein n=1 Tax=Candidatus Pedobacter colombiensis TaxID=3121371 RepID=A0AAJ5W807_9SPHI|nr:hypothetical protein [Pedobacter sp.]WEK18868.1 MAG: hypothetical protein P0Y49_19005 [Pedobacter sp.]
MENVEKEKMPMSGQEEERERSTRFGKNELQLLNLIAEIIVEIVMKDDDGNDK